MIIKYNIDISQRAVEKELERLINQIYKLLPSREEGLNWELPLATVLLCKLEGLFTLTGEDDFFIFRRTIFECLGIVNNLKDELC